MLFVAVAAISYPVVANAAVETFTISSYSESFVPAENNDAILNIEMTAKTSDEGVIYIPMSVAESELIRAQVDGKEVINLTAVLLTLCLVALSYIIMSVSTYIISVINKVAIVKIINKAKQEVQEVDDISEFIEQENEY
jgi:hypothetical protein